MLLVGAGTAGTTVASGLQSDDILILESGGFTTELLDIPIVTPMLQNSVFDWCYETVPQWESCLGLSDKKSRWPRGKGFGGSQILNYMIWARGHYEDFRGWFSSWSE